MSKIKELYLGDNLINSSDIEISGKEVVINNENFYKISNVNKMRPFFMSIVSAYDHWLFISSSGALSAGRKNSNNSLFPYYTDDKISESYEVTGGKSIFHINKGGKNFLWEPFTKSSDLIYKTKRNLYKNLRGNKVIFEEINNLSSSSASLVDLGCGYGHFLKYVKNNSEIQNLKAKIDSHEMNMKLTVNEAVVKVEKERDELKNNLKQAELEKQLSEKSLKEKFEISHSFF